MGAQVISSDIDFSFPVLGFTRDRENWGFANRDKLTSCGPRTLKENMQEGMELIDAGGRRWRVKSIRRVGRAGSLLSLVPGFGPVQSRIEQELEELPSVSLAEVQEMAKGSLQTFSSDYKGFEGDEEEFAVLLDKVSQARSIEEIYIAMQPDTFEPY